MEYKGWVSLLLLLLSFSLRNHEIKARSLVKEDFELEETLMILNRRPIVSVKDEGGALFDCVDIYDQPAFHHPLLKNHKIQTNPNLEDIFIDETSSNDARLMTLPKPLNCPDGTVPIRRTRKEDLIRERAVTTYPQHYANIQKSKSGDVFYGSQATMNILNPKVDANQGSMAVIQLWNDTAGEALIHAGWAVSPHIYGDYRTHLHTSWRENDRGCMNMKCPGFVQVSKNYPIGMVLKSSAYNEQPSEIQILVIQDKSTMNWWLILPALSVRIGYWPSSLLPHLDHGATDIAWGGLAVQYKPNVPSPPLGFGLKPDKSQMTHSGYFASVSVVYEHDTKLPPDHSWKPFVNNWDCYGADYSWNDDGFFAVYGGPGGNC